MTASTRSLIWLSAIFVGLLPLAADPEESFMAGAWDRLAAWDGTEDDICIPPDHLIRRDTNPIFSSACGVQSGATAPMGSLFPPNGDGITQCPFISRPVTRPPPIT